jgi:hypothetical protein
MKLNSCATMCLAALVAAVLPGCASRDKVGITNQNQPGPVIGRAVGTGVGAVVGNVAGAGVGIAEGTGSVTASAFDNTQRVVRYWHEEKTPDGRVIMVSDDFLVDANGRILRKMK